MSENTQAAPVAATAGPRRRVVVRGASAPVISYVTPAAAGVRNPNEILWNGADLVIPDGGSIADRCIRCNAESDGVPVKRNLSWHSRALFLLILFPGLLIYLIVALIVRKRATVYVGLCAHHRRRRRVLITVAWGAFVAALVVLVLGAGVRDGNVGGLMILGGIMGMLASMIMGVLVSQQLGYPSCIRPPFVFLRNVNRHYPARR